MLLMGAPLLAQETAPEDRLLNSDPQQLLVLNHGNVNALTMTSLADFENRDVREAPGYVQVITARQIQASGAVDLYDALELVPGLSIARGEDDVFGVAIHGNWAGEGKCLFLLDGRQLNENDFGTFGIGLRVPLANVDRIEVMMGPGAVLHGGYASLGVVNIVTRTADTGSGSRASFRSGYSNNAFTTTRVSISGTHRLSRDQEISYMTSHVRGRRSNALRLMPDSSLLNFADSTATQANTFQFNYRWRDLQATMVYMDQTSMVSDAAYSIEQRNILLGLGYDRKLSGKVRATAQLNWADQLPRYYVNTTNADQLLKNTANEHISGAAALIYKPYDWLSGRVGTRVFHQSSSFSMRADEAVYRLNDQRSISMDDAAFFAEMAIYTKVGLLSAGYRMEQNSLSGAYTAPRLAYTKVLGPVHLKLMWSQASKMPTVMNINDTAADTVLLTERAETKGAEVGIRLFHGFNLSANLYSTTLTDPFVRLHNAQNGDSYISRASGGTNGFDLRGSYESKKLTVMAGYASHEPLAGADLPEMELPLSHRAYQGIAATRAYLLFSFDLLPSLTLRAKATWRDQVWSYQHKGGDTLSLVAWPEELIYQAGLTIHTGRNNRVSIDLDCRNLTGADRTVVGPDTRATAPFALNGREFMAGLTYKFVQ